MNLIRIRFEDYGPIYKKIFYLSLIIYSLSLMINNYQIMNNTSHWCTTPDQDMFVTIEAMGHNSQKLPKVSVHPGYGHKLLYAYYFKLLNLLNISEYHKLEDFCETPDPLKIWPVMIKNGKTLSFLLFFVFCLIMGLTCWQMTGKPWALPIGFYFCSLFPGGQVQSIMIRSELIATIMGCTGILFALMSLNAKRYLSYITFAILSGTSIFVAVITKIQALPFLCFIVAMFVFFPTNKSKFIENISAKMLTAPAAGMIFMYLIVYEFAGLLTRFNPNHSLLYKAVLLGIILVSFLFIFLYYSLKTRFKNIKALKRILQLIPDYSFTKNKFSFEWLLANKLFAFTSLIVIILIIYSVTPLWTILWSKISQVSLLNNSFCTRRADYIVQVLYSQAISCNLYYWGLTIVSCLLIFLSYSLRKRLENKLLRRMLSIGYFLLGFFFLGITFLNLSLWPLHILEGSLQYSDYLLSLFTGPESVTPYIDTTEKISLSFLYSVFLKWTETYSYFHFLLICFSCYFFSSKKISIYNKSIFVSLILTSYLYSYFSSFRYYVNFYLIFSDVFLIFGFIFLLSELSNLIVLNKFFRTCFKGLVVACIFSLPIFMPPNFGTFNPPSFGFYRPDMLNGCVPWSSPYSGVSPWVQDKYIQCMQKAYPTEEIFIQKFDALDTVILRDLNRKYLSK